MSTKEQLREQWAERIAEFRASGMSQVAWCSANHYSIHQLKYWLYRSNLSSSSVPSSASSMWAPLAIIDAGSASESSLVIRVGKISIDVRTGFDPVLLRDVIRAVEDASSC